MSKAPGATLAHSVWGLEQYPVDLGPWAHTGWDGVGVHRLLRTHVGSRCHLTSTCWQERLPPQKLELPSPRAVLPGDLGGIEDVCGRHNGESLWCKPFHR